MSFLPAPFVPVLRAAGFFGTFWAMPKSTVEELVFVFFLIH